jgi:hypothetical protein
LIDWRRCPTYTFGANDGLSLYISAGQAVSLVLSTMWLMGEVIDIVTRRQRRAEAVAARPSALTRPAEHPKEVDAPELEMLERAVERLHVLLSKAPGRGGQLEGKVETELLAIMGELTLGLVREAARRAGRLADRLADA